MGTVSTFDMDSQMKFGDVITLGVWFLSHSLEHMAMAAMLTEQYSIQPPLFDLVDQQAIANWAALMQKESQETAIALRNWLLAHQKLHDAESGAANVANGYDLTAVDFSKADEFYDWMYNHQQLHDAEAQVL